MNLNYSKLRNQLSPAKAAKIVYIYMNQRALDSTGDRLWVDDENWEKVAMEDEVMETDDSDEDKEDSEDNDDEEDEDIDMDGE